MKHDISVELHGGKSISFETGKLAKQAHGSCIVRIGDNVQCGPNVQICAATHPLAAEQRILGPELGAPITIGDNVWLGAGAIVLAGVTIGANTTIGAGSVVNRDIPANVLAAGNPCRVIRDLG